MEKRIVRLGVGKYRIESPRVCIYVMLCYVMLCYVMLCMEEDVRRSVDDSLIMKGLII